MELHITLGLPGSGKTTYTYEQHYHEDRECYVLNEDNGFMTSLNQMLNHTQFHRFEVVFLDVMLRTQKDVIDAITLIDGYKSVSKVFITVFKPHYENNRIASLLRGRPISEQVWSRMYADWEFAEEFEVGWPVEFTFVDSYKPTVMEVELAGIACADKDEIPVIKSESWTTMSASRGWDDDWEDYPSEDPLPKAMMFNILEMLIPGITDDELKELSPLIKLGHYDYGDGWYDIDMRDYWYIDYEELKEKLKEMKLRITDDYDIRSRVVEYVDIGGYYE